MWRDRIWQHATSLASWLADSLPRPDRHRQGIKSTSVAKVVGMLSPPSNHQAVAAVYEKV